MATRDWLELINDMLWIFEREIKLTLRGVNDDFKYIGLTFDPDFRFQFLNIIINRTAKTYDQFMVDLESQEHQPKSAANQIAPEHPSVVQSGEKRKITNNEDDSNDLGNGQDDETSAVKRARTNGNAPVAGVIATADDNDGDDLEQNQDNDYNDCITDDNSTTHNERENGNRSIDSDEAFRQGYVVVIPMKTVDGCEAAGSESGSSVGNRQTPATSVGRRIKSEPSLDIDVEETITDAASPSPPPSLSLSQVQLSQNTSPPTPRTTRQSAKPSTTAADFTSPPSKDQAKDITPARVTRKSSRDRPLKTNSTPLSKDQAKEITPAKVTRKSSRDLSNSTPSNPAPGKVNGSVAVNQSTPNSAETSKSASKKQQRRKSIAQESSHSFQCRQCGYTTAWKCNFSRHLLIHNDANIDLERFQCEKCAHLSDLHSSLPSNANKIENPPFVCKLCWKKFPAKDLLDIHYMAVHRNKCPKCKKKFANQQQSEAHEKRCK